MINCYSASAHPWPALRLRCFILPLPLACFRRLPNLAPFRIPAILHHSACPSCNSIGFPLHLTLVLHNLQDFGSSCPVLPIAPCPQPAPSAARHQSVTLKFLSFLIFWTQNAIKKQGGMSPLVTTHLVILYLLLTFTVFYKPYTSSPDILTYPQYTISASDDSSTVHVHSLSVGPSQLNGRISRGIWRAAHASVFIRVATHYK